MKKSESLKIRVQGFLYPYQKAILTLAILSIPFSIFANGHSLTETVNQRFMKSEPLVSVPQTVGVKVSGIVKDKEGSPLPGVTVVIRGTKIGTATNNEGKFSLEMPEKGMSLTLTFIGMKPLEVTVDSPNPLNLIMEEEQNDLDEVIVIGYGTTTKKDLTGSVARFDSKIIEESTVTNIAHMMQGQIAGLSILAGDGAPGSPAKLEIRGVPSLSGATSPLIVVDNVPMPSDFDINELNPDDVKNIDVLKGASSAAIYGSRAAAGVIMITTKSGGRNQKPVITYSYDYSRSMLVSEINTLTTDEFKMLLMEAVRNTAAANGYDDITQYSTYQKFAAPDFFGEANTPWMKYLLRDATKQQHKIAIRGGGSNLGYTASFGYTTEPGTVKATDYKRYTYDLGLDADVNKWITARIKVSGNFSDRLSCNAGLSDAAKARPDLKAYNDDGTLYLHSYEGSCGTTYVVNPIIEMLENTNKDKANNLRLTGALDFKILPSLNLVAQYTYQQRKSESTRYNSSRTQSGSGYWGGQKGQGSQGLNSGTNQEFEARLTFNRHLGEYHDLSVVAASTYTKEDAYNYSITLTDYPDDYVQNAIWQATKPAQYNWIYGDASGSVLVSFVARAEYKFMDRYLLTGTVRSDGSSKFSPSHRWGTFPSLAAAWIVTEENFLKDSQWLSFLKIRAGWGKTGNGWVGNYGWRTLFTSTDYQSKPATIPSQIGNDQLKWETTKQWDLGFDFGFLKNQRIRGSLGFYKKTTEGLLYPFTMALSTGLESTQINFANIENKGVEFEISADIIQKKDWQWFFSFNIGKNRNKITNLDAQYVSAPGQTYLTNTVIKEGESLGLLYGFQTDGVFQNQAEIDYYESLNVDHQYQEQYSYRKTIPGDLKFVDQNGDGYVNKVYGNHEDKVVLGCSRPKFEGGLNTRLTWKGLTLSIQGSFSYGAKKAWTAEGNQFNFSSYSPANVLDVALKRWTPENRKSKYPCVRLDFYNNDFTDFAIHDASYLKIQNINLEYRLPRNLVKKTMIFDNISFFASANNVHTFTSYPGPSPESWSSDAIQGASVDSDAYPKTRTFNFGVKVTIK